MGSQPSTAAAAGASLQRHKNDGIVSHNDDENAAAERPAIMNKHDGDSDFGASCKNESKRHTPRRTRYLEEEEEEEEEDQEEEETAAVSHHTESKQRSELRDHARSHVHVIAQQQTSDGQPMVPSIIHRNRGVSRQQQPQQQQQQQGIHCGRAQRRACTSSAKPSTGPSLHRAGRRQSTLVRRLQYSQQLTEEIRRSGITQPLPTRRRGPLRTLPPTEAPVASHRWRELVCTLCASTRILLAEEEHADNKVTLLDADRLIYAAGDDATLGDKGQHDMTDDEPVRTLHLLRMMNSMGVRYASITALVDGLRASQWALSHKLYEIPQTVSKSPTVHVRTLSKNQVGSESPTSAAEEVEPALRAGQDIVGGKRTNVDGSGPLLRPKGDPQRLAAKSRVKCLVGDYFRGSELEHVIDLILYEGRQVNVYERKKAFIEHLKTLTNIVRAQRLVRRHQDRVRLRKSGRKRPSLRSELIASSGRQAEATLFKKDSAIDDAKEAAGQLEQPLLKEVTASAKRVQNFDKTALGRQLRRQKQRVEAAGRRLEKLRSPPWYPNRWEVPKVVDGLVKVIMFRRLFGVNTDMDITEQDETAALQRLFNTTIDVSVLFGRTQDSNDTKAGPNYGVDEARMCKEFITDGVERIDIDRM